MGRSLRLWIGSLSIGLSLVSLGLHELYGWAHSRDGPSWSTSGTMDLLHRGAMLAAAGALVASVVAIVKGRRWGRALAALALVASAWAGWNSGVTY